MVEFTSRLASFTGTSFLTGMVFQHFAATSPKIACVKCVGKSEDHVKTLPLFAAVYAYYKDGKPAGQETGYITSGNLNELVYQHAPVEQFGVEQVPKPIKMGHQSFPS